MPLLSLPDALRSKAADTTAWSPALFDLQVEGDRQRLAALFDAGLIQRVSDDYDEQLRELFVFSEPALAFSPDFARKFGEHRAALEGRAPLWQQGRWAYFPWRASLAHILEEREFELIRTSRNRNLIPEDEQRKFAGAVVGVAGLSVGNSVALAIVLQGGARRIRLADFDRLALSNTNRVRSSVVELGANKAEMTARQIYELDPYAQVELFTDGLTVGTIGAFFEGKPKLDVVIDEIDDLAVKCLIREHAKRLGLPVVMAADNGDNGVVDIERYDLDPGLEFFHGRMGEVSYAMLKGLDKLSIGRLITRHVGPETVTPRMRASLLEIGKTIVSWPQLGGAALLNGSAVAYCVRVIANGQGLESDRALISLDEKLAPGGDEDREAAEAEAKRFAKAFGI